MDVLFFAPMYCIALPEISKVSARKVSMRTRGERAFGNASRHLVVRRPIGQEYRFVVTQPRPEADILSGSKKLDKINQLEKSTILQYIS